MRVYTAVDASGLSPYTFGSQGPLWWGMWGLICVESTVFACLIASFFYLQMDQPQWPPAGVEMPKLLMPTIASLCLFASSLPIHWADKAITRGDQGWLRWGLVGGIALAAVFLALKYVEYSEVSYRWDSHAYGSIVWAIVGFHSLHVIALMLKTIVVAVLAWRGYFTKERRLGVEIQGLYWHFVVAVWLPLYLVLYWAPRAL